MLVENVADAGLELLARVGARGLTYRAMDAEAGVPIGTASNYFENRDAMLTALAERYYERLPPPAAALREAVAAPPSRARVAELMRDLFRRVTAQRDLYLAFLELRLESTRRPGLQDALASIIRANLEIDLAFHRAAGLPGDRNEVVLLHLAMGGLLIDQLTVPAGLAISDVDEVITRLVERLHPAG
jgi:AcrR family transcriptional regulator